MHEWQLWEACDHPAHPESSNEDSKLEVHVIFTDASVTRRTLRAAAELARDLRARVTVLVAQVVPYPLPLTSPPVPIEFTERTLWSMAAEQEVDTTIRVYLCRDGSETLRQILKPESVVVMGARKRWWPTVERSLAVQLRQAGHRVILIQ